MPLICHQAQPKTPMERVETKQRINLYATPALGRAARTCDGTGRPTMVPRAEGSNTSLVLHDARRRKEISAPSRQPSQRRPHQGEPPPPPPPPPPSHLSLSLTHSPSLTRIHRRNMNPPSPPPPPHRPEAGADGTVTVAVASFSNFKTLPAPPPPPHPIPNSTSSDIPHQSTDRLTDQTKPNSP